MSIYREIKESFRYGSVLTRLIYINIGVFLILRLIQLLMVLATGNGEFIQPLILFLSVPSAPASFLTHPWSAVTYMFLHYEFLHLIFNILYLYWFGKLFIHLIDSRLLLRTYLYGGLSGAAFYILTFNLIPGFWQFSAASTLLGASAAVMAILFAVAAYQPNHPVYLMFFGEVRLKYVALIAFVIDIISIPTMSNTGGHLSHIGGALMGLYLGWRWTSKGLPARKPMTGGSSFMNWTSKKTQLTVSHKRPLTDMEYNALKVQRQKEIDRILEKIKNSGYDSLTQTEKKTLFEASKER